MIAGKYDRTPRPHAVEQFGFEAESQVDLFDLWRRHRRAYENGRLLSKQVKEAALEPDASAAAEVQDVKPIDPLAYEALKPAGFRRCFVVCAKRAFIQHKRSSAVFAFDIMLHCGTGAFLGLASGETHLASLAQTSLMFSLGLCMTIGLASLRVFGNERVVYWREAAPGAGMHLSPLPYFLGKTLIEIPRLMILTLCLVGFFYPFTKSLCNFQHFYWQALICSWNISGWATMLSVKYNDKSAQLMLVIFCLISLLYAGVQTRLGEMSDPEYAISWLSPNRWLVEDLFTCHASGLSAVYRLPPTWYATKSDSLLGFLIIFSYQESFNNAGGIRQSTQYDVLVSFWFGCLTRAIAFLFLVYANRGQMAQPTLGLSMLRALNRFLNVFWPFLDLEDIMRAMTFKNLAESCCCSSKDLEDTWAEKATIQDASRDSLAAAKNYEDRGSFSLGAITDM